MRRWYFQSLGFCILLAAISSAQPQEPATHDTGNALTAKDDTPGAKVDGRGGGPEVPAVVDGAAEADARPAEGRSGEAQADIYLNDSFEAADAFSKAGEFAAQRRWHDAAELLCKISHELGGRLVRVSTGRYAGVRAHANRLIAAWPAEGLEAYRTVAEPVLRARLVPVTGSKNVDDYLPLFDEFFCTSPAIGIGETIAELAIEAGDFVLARYVLREVLAFHPARADVAERFQARLAVVDAITGRSAPGAAQPTGRIRWKGEDQPTGAVVAEIQGDFQEVRNLPPSSEWPIFAGEQGRNRTAATDVTEPGVLWRYQLMSTSHMSSESSAELLSRSHREAARRLSTFPVAGPELLYVQFDRQVVALHRNTGAPAWRFDSGSAGEEADSFLDDRPPSWNSPTLQDGRLFAALPADQSSYYDTDVEHNGPELVCLNAGTGAHLWSAGAERFEIKPSDFVLDSSPLVAHGRVHIVARRRRSFGFEDSYLYTLRAVDGAVQSRVHLGGASTATFGSRTVTFAIPALHDDTVYVCNGLGSIAAVSAYTGGLQWLTTYDRFRETDTGVPGIAARDLVPWQFNPIIYSNARLVALPTDSRSILVLSETGDVERAVPRESVGQMQTLLGVHEGRICGAGDAIVCFDLSDATKQWSARLPPDQELFGRASMTRDTIWAPTRRALVRFSIGPGKRSEFAWSGKGEGGNVLVLPDSIIVAEPGALAAYGERERIWTSLRERIVAAPNDPLPPLEFAEVAFGVGELDEAVKALQLADKRLAASASADMESVRRRLFTDALTFAQSATSREGTTAIQEFFEIGARQAWDQESNVRYRLRFAEVFDAAGEPTRSAALCQQVLRDRGLRQYPMGNEATSAGQVAELRIAALIDRYGRTVYNDIEEMATEALQVASAARDREAILEVVHTFPNSQTATRALTALGDRHAAEGEFDDARRAYTRAFHRDAPAAERAALIAQIAEMCVKAQKPRDAYLWLSKGALQYPTATVKYDGRRRGFIELRDRMSKESPVVLASRPHLEPPLRESGRRSLDQGARLLTPVLSAPSQGSRTYFIATPLTITAHSARSGAPLWPQPATPPAAAELLVQLDHLAILATKYQVFALDLATGSVAWSMGHEPPHVADPGADWEKGGAVLSHARQDHLLVSARDNGVFTGIDIRDGKVTWSRTMAAPAGAVQLSLPWLVYPTAEGDNNRVKVVDGASGQAVGEIALDGRRPVESLVVTFDGLLLAVTSKSIDCYELETRRPRWSAAIGGQLQLETLQLTPDGVVYADSGRQLRKLSIDDGRELWASASVGNDDSDGLRVEVVEDQLLALTATSVAAIDGVTGVTLWTGAVPDDVRFVRHLMTDDFLATVHTPRGDSKQPMVYLYNLHTGRIPASGGTVEFSNGVGAIENILAVDGTLLLQSADALHAFISSGD